MSQANHVFKRIEKKYRLSPWQYQALSKALQEHNMQPDIYGLHTIGSLYLDTDGYDLIRRSIDKPIYKEKLRLRCYGTPTQDSTVYLEIKKKFKGEVVKRRADMSLQDAYAYLYDHISPPQGGQILREIDYAMRLYDHPTPKVLVAYDRIALFSPQEAQLRVTMDANVRYRFDQMDLRDGLWGTPLLQKGEILMEIKAPGAFPLWLCQTLSALGIYPASFSKVGTAYRIHTGKNIAKESLANVS